MSDSPPLTFLTITDGGIGASHVPTSPLRVTAGPATGSESNLIRSALIPLACWRLGDIRFAFDSSFIIPEARSEFQVLAQLIAEHGEKTPFKPGETLRPPPLSIFGHTDPTGNDDYNKALSGRRAAAIYAALTRRTDIWEDLFSNKGTFAQPAPGDLWGDPAIQSMRAALKRTETGKTTTTQRQSLFLEYMNFLCVDDQVKPFQVDPVEGFLGQKGDAHGKGDYQGCCEFNPILVFSRADKQKFDQQKDHTARDAANAPNRRVVVLLFRPGSRITPGLWPCPRAKEPVAACRKRFFSDGERRRSVQENQREFKDQEDTFACRFYQRLVTRSPCERGLKTFRVRLYDAFGRTIPAAPFSFSIGSRKFTELSSASPEGIITLADVQVPETCVIKWGFKPEKDETPELLFTRTIFLVADSEPSAQAAQKKLHNLGYDDADLKASVTGFQLDFGHLVAPPLDASGELDDPTLKLLDRLYQQSLEDLRQTDVSGEGS